MSEYTKGNWEPFLNSHFWEVTAPSPEHPNDPVSMYSPSVAFVWQVGEPSTQEANAHLIAAAPELLEALKAVRSQVCGDAICAQIDAAIAKAGGK